MACLVRDAPARSPYWSGVYLVVSPVGQRRWVCKSTKKRKQSEAKEILDAWQKTADRAAAGNLDQARIREIILETVERVTGKRTDSPTVAEWFERWIRTEKGAVAARTMMRYEQSVRDFLSRGDWRSRTTHAGLRAEVASLVSKGTDHHTECHHSRIIQTNASIRENPGATDFALAISKEHNGLVDR